MLIVQNITHLELRRIFFCLNAIGLKIYRFKFMEEKNYCKFIYVFIYNFQKDHTIHKLLMCYISDDNYCTKQESKELNCIGSKQFVTVLMAF